jgi:dTDP-4-dehydrorhamnose 3,5-epimerase
MKVERTAIPEVLVLEPQVFGDARGYFLESYNRRKFREATGLDVDFVQDNQSFSSRNVLRGLHYQIRQPQGKLVTPLIGEIYDVVVDLRRSSPTFRKWVAVELSAATHRMIWVPVGFAHGFLVRSEQALVLYKTTDFYAPEHERVLHWADPAIGVRWPHRDGDPILAKRDSQGLRINELELFE